MKNSFPLVSVLMTSYNREQFIAEAIESVLASTYRNFELIIVDDCSCDKTVQIAYYFAKKDQRIKVYVNEQNLGDYRNRNKAASYAKGEFIMFVDSDDTIFKNGLEKCVSTMLQFPSSGFGIFFPDLSITPLCLSSEIALRQHFFQRPYLIIGPGGTIIRRTFFEKIGSYPVQFGPANDMYFNLKAACYTSTVLLTFHFMKYRIHEGQEKNNQFAYLYNNYNFNEEAISKLPLPLTVAEKKWLLKKNRRRFFVNLIKHLKKTRSISTAYEAVKRTDYSFKDAIQGIFH